MSSGDHYDVLIVGSGEGGKYLAWHMARGGHRTAVVERKLIGGSRPNTNCLPSKNEIWSAKVADLVCHADRFGSMVEEATVDMRQVLARKRAMVDNPVAMHLVLLENPMLLRSSLGLPCRRPPTQLTIGFLPSTVWPTWAFVEGPFSIERRSFLRRFATALLVVVLAGAASPIQAPSQEPKFLVENQEAMAKMMSAMDVQPSGDVDHDFVATMVPHHQGAIDMALAELRYGRNEQLRRIAQEIIVEQGQEIAAMQLALGEHLLPGVPEPDQDHHGTQRSMTGTMQMPRSSQ